MQINLLLFLKDFFRSSLAWVIFLKMAVMMMMKVISTVLTFWKFKAYIKNLSLRGRIIMFNNINRNKKNWNGEMSQDYYLFIFISQQHMANLA